MYPAMIGISKQKQPTTPIASKQNKDSGLFWKL